MLRLLLLLFLCAFGAATAVCGPNDADRVVIVRNLGSEASRAIVDDYSRRCGVRRMVDVNCADSASAAANETIAYADYLKAIESPLRTYLAGHPEIDYIVLTKGIPIRLSGVPQGIGQPGRLALDSVLASLDYEKTPGAIRVDISDPNYGPSFHGQAWANRFWNSQVPFSHAALGGYLVTRLDGYTVTDAMALTSRSLAARGTRDAGKAPTGTILLDICPASGFTDKARQPYSIRPLDHDTTQPIAITRESRYGEYNSDMQLAGDLLGARRIPCRVEATDLFLGAVSGVMGYASWGSNDGHYDATAYHALAFAPGAIAETAVSTSGRTFVPTQGGQSLVADLIAQGVSGVKGYTDEPLLQAIASPSIMFERYTRGWTLADSLYAASALVGWQDIVIGDPLCRAYPEPSRAASQ